MNDSTLISAVSNLAFAAAVVPIQLPVRIGDDERYELQELLSKTTRSHVYLAVDRRFEQEGKAAHVIVKITTSNEHGLAEALTARHIEHPFVVRVLDRGRTPSNEHFLVLEYASSGDLSAQSLPWDPRKAATFMSQLASAVQAAHSAGVVHCDLKPANVLVTERGEPRLTDFDLATSVVDGSKTLSRGSLAFAAPEQLRGDEGALTQRADVYALGGLLYYLLSGRFPNGETHEEITALNKGERTRPKLSTPEPLAYIAERALSLDPWRRHATADQFEADLKAWLESRPLPSRSTGALAQSWLWCRRRPFHAVTAGALVVLVIGGTAGLVVWRSLEQARELRTARQAQALAQFEMDKLKDQIANQVYNLAIVLRTTSSLSSPERIMGSTLFAHEMEQMLFNMGDPRMAIASAFTPALKQLVEAAVQSGRSDHMDTQIIRLEIAVLLLRDGEYAEAQQWGDEAEKFWNGRMLRGEQLEIIQRLVSVTSRAFQEIQRQKLSPALCDKLYDLRSDLLAGPPRESMLWLVNQAIAGKLPPTLQNTRESR